MSRRETRRGVAGVRVTLGVRSSVGFSTIWGEPAGVVQEVLTPVAITAAIIAASRRTIAIPASQSRHSEKTSTPVSSTRVGAAEPSPPGSSTAGSRATRTAARVPETRPAQPAVAVVPGTPVMYAAPAGGGEWGDLARRLWALERETLRHRYQRLGAAVVEWGDAMHLQQVLLEVEACRRRAGLAPG